METRPTYEFFIPSVYDDTALACRIYSLPESYFGGGPEAASTREKPWTSKGAIVAHPYSGLGGSYDDSTVLHAVDALMERGFTVGTFNLRGAGKSKGKATWTSKAELQDYISFVGFFMYYLSNVYPPIEESQSFDDYFPLAPIISGVPATRPPAHLILAGYSYGALLTRFLPRVPVLLGRFAKVLKTSTEAEIRLRAAKLAAVTHIDILSRPLYGLRESHKTRKGKEREKGNRPRDQLEETPRDWTVEKDGHMQYLQKPFVRKHKRDSWPDQHNELGPDADDYIARVYVPTPKTHYLLISLLLEPLASFCTGFRILGDTELDTKFLYNSTMMLHGEKDRLTSFKKLSFWADDLVEDSEGKCNVVGVENSGHFWRDKKAIESLKFSIGFWVLITVNDERQSS